MTDEILSTIKNSCIEISTLIRNSDSVGLAKLIKQTNQAGDEVKKIDVLCNNILKTNLMKCPEVRLLASEEEPSVVSTDHQNGKYLVCFDPLDGSSNVSVNITVGTIFAIFKIRPDRTILDGRDIVMAGYCLYGGCTQLIVANNTNVKMYTLVDDKFSITESNIKMPQSGNTYAINESNKYTFIDHRYNDCIDKFIRQGKTARWVGSLVADAHRTLLKGGFFAYPGNTAFPNGKLRLLYEVYPFAYIIEKAGGVSSDGKCESLLDTPFPKNPHRKIPVIFASKSDMKTFDNPF